MFILDLCFVRYIKGDFSFILNNTLRHTLQYDYNNCFKDILKTNNLDFEYFKNSACTSLPSIDEIEIPNTWDTPPGDDWEKIRKKVYPLHNQTTYERNMKILYFMKINGWKKTVKNYKKRVYPFC